MIDIFWFKNAVNLAVLEIAVEYLPEALHLLPANVEVVGSLESRKMTVRLLLSGYGVPTGPGDEVELIVTDGPGRRSVELRRSKPPSDLTTKKGKP